MDKIRNTEIRKELNIEPIEKCTCKDCMTQEKCKFGRRGHMYTRTVKKILEEKTVTEEKKMAKNKNE